MANVELPEANRIVTQAFVLGWFENLHRFWGIMPPGLKLKTTSSQGNNVWASRPDAKGLKIMSTKEFGIWDIGMVMRQGIPGCLTIQKYGDVIKHDIAGRA